MQYANFEQFLIVLRGLQPITIRGYVDAIKRLKNKLGSTPCYINSIVFGEISQYEKFCPSYC